MRRLWFVLALWIVATPAAAATYYVSPSGNNANAGTLASPFQTVTKGVSMLFAGDTLYLRSGTYTESCNVVPRNGTAANLITIARYQSETVTFNGCSIISFNAVSYVVFDGVIIDIQNNNYVGVYFGNGSHHDIARNLEIKNAHDHGVQVNITTDAIQLLNLKIHDNGNDYFDNAIYIESTNNIVDGCELYSNTGSQIQLWRDDGGALSNNIVRNNYIHDTSGDVSIARGGAPQLQGIVIGHATNTLVYNNLIVNMTIAINRVASMGDAALTMFDTGSGNAAYHNTIYNIHNADGLQIDSKQSGTPKARNNVVYLATGGINNQAAGATVSNNLTTNPSFVNAGAIDFRLASGSTAIDTGIGVGITVDRAGVTRPLGAGYDIGAYEYQPPASQLISTARSLDWTAAGTTIQTRSTICTTLQPPSSSSAINAAIAACGSGQVVKLAAGTFTINGGLNISRNDVTLRGSGPTQTTLALQSYDSCNGLGAGICVTGSGSVPFPPDTPRNLANWTAGFAKGATAITLSSVANLQVGSTIILDQLDDSTPDFNGIANCANRTGAQATWCSGEGANNLSMDSQRVQHETHKVVSIAGNVVTITPALAWPNWSLSKTPHAWWGSSLPVTGVGIEDLKLDATNEGCGAFFSSCGGILFFYAADSWVKNVEVFKMAISQMKLYESRNITIRDSYLRTSKSLGSTAYGLLLFYSSYNLIENNIFQDIVAGALLHGVGNVVGYNYMLDNTYNPSGAPFPPGNSQMQAGMYHHNGGAGYELWEGNDANSFKADAIHGTSNLTTVFRNRLSGYETLKDQHTNPVFVYAWNRYFNFLGNVLGTSTYHTTSGTYASSFNSSAIYRFGETPNYCPWAGSSGGGCTVTGGFTDARVAATSMRWGNYDTVHAANQFVSAEVPSGDANYPNPVPANQTLPTSFYRSTTAPTWWATPWGTPGYPAIGPDVTGGSIAGLAGHAQKIPARLCYENMSHTTTGSTTGTIQLISNFNADVCYPTTGSPTDTTAPVVTITTNGGANFSTIDPLLTTLAGGAVDDIQVMFDCRWTNAANAGAGTAPGAFTWSVASIPLALGPNLITVYCHDAANNEGNDTITVTLDQPPPSGPFYRLRIGG